MEVGLGLELTAPGAAKSAVETKEPKVDESKALHQEAVKTIGGSTQLPDYNDPLWNTSVHNIAFRILDEKGIEQMLPPVKVTTVGPNYRQAVFLEPPGVMCTSASDRVSLETAEKYGRDIALLKTGLVPINKGAHFGGQEVLDTKGYDEILRADKVKNSQFRANFENLVAGRNRFRQKTPMIMRADSPLSPLITQQVPDEVLNALTPGIKIYNMENLELLQEGHSLFEFLHMDAAAVRAEITARLGMTSVHVLEKKMHDGNSFKFTRQVTPRYDEPDFLQMIYTRGYEDEQRTRVAYPFSPGLAMVRSIPFTGNKTPILDQLTRYSAEDGVGFGKMLWELQTVGGSARAGLENNPNVDPGVNLACQLLARAAIPAAKVADVKAPLYEVIARAYGSTRPGTWYENFDNAGWPGAMEPQFSAAHPPKPHLPDSATLYALLRAVSQRVRRYQPRNPDHQVGPVPVFATFNVGDAIPITSGYVTPVTVAVSPDVSALVTLWKDILNAFLAMNTSGNRNAVTADNLVTPAMELSLIAINADSHWHLEHSYVNAHDGVRMTEMRHYDVTKILAFLAMGVGEVQKMDKSGPVIETKWELKDRRPRTQAEYLKNKPCYRFVGARLREFFETVEANFSIEKPRSRLLEAQNELAGIQFEGKDLSNAIRWLYNKKVFVTQDTRPLRPLPVPNIFQHAMVRRREPDLALPTVSRFTYGRNFEFGQMDLTDGKFYSIGRFPQGGRPGPVQPMPPLRIRDPAAYENLVAAGLTIEDFRKNDVEIIEPRDFAEFEVKNIAHMMYWQPPRQGLDAYHNLRIRDCPLNYAHYIHTNDAGQERKRVLVKGVEEVDAVSAGQKVDLADKSPYSSHVIDFDTVNKATRHGPALIVKDWTNPLPIVYRSYMHPGPFKATTVAIDACPLIPIDISLQGNAFEIVARTAHTVYETGRVVKERGPGPNDIAVVDRDSRDVWQLGVFILTTDITVEYKAPESEIRQVLGHWSS